MSTLTISEWHAQFVRQARWTQMTRNQLYRRARLLRAQRVLDVGCGTGVLTAELARRTRGQVIGLDLDPDMLTFAREHDDRAHYEKGDAHALPYPDEHFDLVICHYVLLWVSDPLRVLHEMARVICRRGAVLVCAEPDYGGRLDWPDLPIREWQVDGLCRQGAHPHIGRQVRDLLTGAGLRSDVGIVPSHWDARALGDNFEAEWTLLRHDVGDAVDEVSFVRVKNRAREAIEEGTRLVYVPTFYAIGRPFAPLGELW